MSLPTLYVRYYALVPKSANPAANVNPPTPQDTGESVDKSKAFPIFDVPPEIEQSLVQSFKDAEHFPLTHVGTQKDLKKFGLTGEQKEEAIELHDKLHYYGVYIIFYTGSHEIYKDLVNYNNKHVASSGKPQKPIYVGKAIASGSRTGNKATHQTQDELQNDQDDMTLGSSRKALKLKAPQNKSLLGRLREHLNSIKSANQTSAENNLEKIKADPKFSTNDFNNMLQHHTDDLRPEDFQVCVIRMPSALVQWAEATLITMLSPVWNSTISGFGNHSPGSGRDKQKRSVWDQLHPGRKWAFKLNNAAPIDQSAIRNRIRADLQKHL